MFPPIEDLVPHHPPMRLVNALVECSEGSATATACFAANHFAVTEGRVLDAALVECVAQTAAASLGWRARQSGQTGPPPAGMLVAINNFQFHTPVLANQPFRITIREKKRLGPMLMIVGEIFCEDQLAAGGELTLYA